MCAASLSWHADAAKNRILFEEFVVVVLLICVYGDVCVHVYQANTRTRRGRGEGEASAVEKKGK